MPKDQYGFRLFDDVTDEHFDTAASLVQDMNAVIDVRGSADDPATLLANCISLQTDALVSSLTGLALQLKRLERE